MNVIQGNFGGSEPKTAIEMLELLHSGLKNSDNDLSELEIAVILSIPGELFDVLEPNGSAENAIMLIAQAQHFIVNKTFGED